MWLLTRTDEFLLKEFSRSDKYSEYRSVRSSIMRAHGFFFNLLLTERDVSVAFLVAGFRGRMSNSDICDLVWDALRSDGIEIALRPIYRWLNRNTVRYHECLVACPDRDGREMLAREFVPALEERGLIRLFDRHVFRRVVVLLGEQPELVVEVNVSALSAVVDVSWEAVFLSLSYSPNIAHRLVVLISKTASVDASRVWAFVRRLQELGCPVSVS
jgi:EAL domain-containing protein (putative c-di-GMP-specific phosphodiesterase class I)